MFHSFSKVIEKRSRNGDCTWTSASSRDQLSFPTNQGLVTVITKIRNAHIADNVAASTVNKPNADFVTLALISEPNKYSN